MKIAEIKTGDIKARAGLIVTDGDSVLACKPTPSSRWPDPKLDIPKGHIQSRERPIDVAIRECYEETNILFEPWKLNKPKITMLEGEPLYLWEVRLSALPPIESLSCASTFIDDSIGVRKPEMAGYVYLPIYAIRKLGLYKKFQERLWGSIHIYFNDKTEYPFEDHRICADKLNLLDGVYQGKHSGYSITLDNGVEFKTVWGVRGRNIPCIVKVRNGLVYRS